MWLTAITSLAVPNPFVMEAKYTISITSLVCCVEEGKGEEEEDVVSEVTIGHHNSHL